MLKIKFIGAVAVATAIQCAQAITAAEIQKRIDDSIAASGGLLRIMPKGNVVRVVNAQKAVPPAFFGPLIKDVQKIGINIPFEVNDATALLGQDPMALANSSGLMPKTGAVIALVEVRNFPTLLIAPENAWAILNVWNLKADKPSKQLLETRVTKEFWRALAGGLGGLNSTMGPCVMRPVAKLKDLDRIQATRLGPEPTMKVIQSLATYGIDTIRELTYEDACQEGIAPQPTNDIQKAIWEKVHAIPDKPMKITFDPATQNGKVTK